MIYLNFKYYSLPELCAIIFTLSLSLSPLVKVPSSLDLNFLKSKVVEHITDEPIAEQPEGEKVESIGESGRLFVRNLAYTTSEEDLTQLFERYGQLTEMNLLIDKSTGSSIGLAYVTFMFPEHAVRAFSELDGSVFQGRLIHLLPSRPPRKEVGMVTSANESEMQSSSSYKTKRNEKLKSEAGSSHNWNALFLGSNAVADSTADQFGVRKSELLDLNTTQSLAVRLALGETQLVSETREFLESHGVKLSSFNNEDTTDTKKRSKTVLLAKNLPFGTSTRDLTDLFSPFGSLSRVILPPAGVSALIEYSSSSNARKAFKKLAYSEFKSLPLYLEWAPFELQQATLDGHKFELQFSLSPQTGIELSADVSSKRKKSVNPKGPKTKILMRNVPFEASRKELLQLCGTFGKLKNLRLPKKQNEAGHHRGFCFVEYVTGEDARSAFESLYDSTHLYGRRLVLEWADADDNIDDIRAKTAQRFYQKGEENTRMKKSKKMTINDASND